MRRHAWLLGFLMLAPAACEDGTAPDTGGVASVTISPARDTLLAVLDTVRLRAEVRDGSGAPVAGAAVRWASLDSTVASVDSAGRVVARGAGTARITASVDAAADTALVVVDAASPAPRFVSFRTGAPLPATLDTSFWAVRGESTELEIRHRPAGGDDDDEDGEKLLEFRVPGDGLLRYPDGRAFARGDSVRIRIRLDPAGLFLFEMEPTGLRFDPEHPAELRVFYGLAEMEDLDEEDSFYLWRRERPGDPWLRIATVRLKEDDEVRADVTGFSAFSLALP